MAGRWKPLLIQAEPKEGALVFYMRKVPSCFTEMVLGGLGTLRLPPWVTIPLTRCTLVKLTETEGRAEVARHWGECGLLFSGGRAPIWEDEDALEVNDGDVC